MLPADRFPQVPYLHPRRQERGKSYTFAAATLDDVWGFDPALFGISPREAEQIDPQQRILLQLTWEALEDAGILPSSLQGTRVGVYVGGSLTDYSNAVYGDPAIGDGHFATGNALAGLSNRISYCFDLRGPSMTIDTACSSSLVALHHAVESLRNGSVDMAVVGGVNVIGSPLSFVSFSQASMLSPSGQCRAFDASADGFVRGEGGVVVVLRRAASADAEGNPIRGIIVGSDVNSDGRTNGISLPSLDAQAALLDRVYKNSGIDLSSLAFVEAHGTGTPVGDPIEATAIGRSLGSFRNTTLPIGSIKTNIGHLEPASGLAGLLKAILSLNHSLLPRSLNFETPNPHIAFDDLNLSVCNEPLELTDSHHKYAGVNSFGFGGTNAHVIVAAGRDGAVVANENEKPKFFTLSAATSPALMLLSKKYGAVLASASEQQIADVARGAAFRRDRLSHRLVVTTTKREGLLKALEAYQFGQDDPSLTVGKSDGENLPVAFVFSGNGSQTVGMGMSAYEQNAVFAARFDEIDTIFEGLSGWSLKTAMFDEHLAERLPQTNVAQPLIFAIQGASTAAIRAMGLSPAAVFGHSVGEIAAAEACGALDLTSAVDVVFYRSKHQQLIRNAGGMAIIAAGPDKAMALAGTTDGVEIAAFNSPRSTTVAGTHAGLARLKARAETDGIAFLDLGLDYPFHTALMAPVERPLLADLQNLTPHESSCAFISTVTGRRCSGLALGAGYWWRNAREPVRFSDAIGDATESGIKAFVEIGPSSILIRHINDNLKPRKLKSVALSALSGGQEKGDPFAGLVAQAYIAGLAVDEATLFGTDPGGAVPLPSYAWQQKQYRFTPTVESIEPVESRRHVFAGSQRQTDALEWLSHIDTSLFPELLDHRVGMEVLFPGTGFLEIAQSVARQWLKKDHVSLVNAEILAPLLLSDGTTYEVLTRVSPTSNIIEILSRRRFSNAGWIHHLRCKMVQPRPRGQVNLPDTSAGGRHIDQAALYSIADRSGLKYGPAFRLAHHVVMHSARLISVALTGGSADPRFLLDPIRLDACIHGVISIFPRLRAVERGVALIPVRVDELHFFQTGASPQSALIEITGENDRTIVANFYIFDANNDLIALMRGARCQEIPVRRTDSLEAIAIAALPTPATGAFAKVSGVAFDAASIIHRARELQFVSEAPASKHILLLDAWATAVAYEIASSLQTDGRLDPDSLILQNRLPDDLRAWFVNLLRGLERAGLANQDGDQGWHILQDATMPSSISLIAIIAKEFPGDAKRIIQASELSAFAARIKSDKAVRELASEIVSGQTQDLAVVGDAVHADLQDHLWQLIAPALRSLDKAPRVLMIGSGPLAAIVASAGLGAVVSVFEPEHRLADIAINTLPKRGDVLLQPMKAIKESTYDVILASDRGRFLNSEITLRDLQERLAPGGLFVGLERQPSFFADIVSGVESDWFSAGPQDFPVGPLASENEWESMLSEAGFANADAQTLTIEDENVTLFAAVRTPEMTAAAPAVNLAVDVDGVSPWASELAALLSATNEAASVQAQQLVWIVAKTKEAASSVDDLTARCMHFKALADRAPAHSTIWLICNGALDGSDIDPVATAVWIFSRTLANEFPQLQIRRIDVAAEMTAQDAAPYIDRVIRAQSAETEISIGSSGIRCIRADSIKRFASRTSAVAEAASLRRGRSSSARVEWQSQARTAPETDGVEIAVEATGVNFRDLMFSLGMLPEDILENGYTGPTLGLECAGRVLRVGSAVKNFAPGDRVLAFARSSFSTHVTTAADLTVAIPDHLSFDEAATLPVTFLTAYYSLVVQAKLKKGEYVLIHGGAGGVGLAAIQVAKMRGAKCIVTAGTRAKRHLLKALGVDHVLDSRSTSFVDGVRDITDGRGVDVVLNSLAGEQMEQSLGCVASFGRFVELGKRDFVANSQIGLRLFRNNVSYFGVDVDQIMLRRGVARKALGSVVSHLKSGKFKPLPHTVFTAQGVADAFQLMQQSAHIGKIIVHPPASGDIAEARPEFVVDPNGTHLVTGAFGGFGMETVKWLVERGARYLVLIGRKGLVSDEAQATIRELESQGATILSKACDVADSDALTAVFDEVRVTLPPITGIIHAAMVLDDRILNNMTEDSMRSVLMPKVKGIDNLDALSRDLQLSYFVAYSSVTTLIGNPGQANYVAANGYMEGVVRRRRLNGLPGLAVGWGPITDVGAVARSEKLKAGLEKLTGVRGMTSREALDLLGQAISESRRSANFAVLTIAPSSGSFGAGRLAVLDSPTYAAMMRGGTGEASSAETFDLPALLQNEDHDAVSIKVTEMISKNIARVLHLALEDVSVDRPLGEIGLDSLMALELGLNLQESLGFRLTLAGSTGQMTIAALTQEIIAQASQKPRDEEGAATVVMLAHVHAEQLKDEHVQLLKGEMRKRIHEEKRALS